MSVPKWYPTITLQQFRGKCLSALAMDICLPCLLFSAVLPEATDIKHHEKLLQERKVFLAGFRVSWSTVATKQENSLLKCQANAQLLVEGWELLLWPFIYATVGPRFLHDCLRRLSLAPTTCCQVSALLGVMCCLAVGIPKQHLGAAAAAWWEYARLLDMNW